jgi:hypothetical protein
MDSVDCDEGAFHRKIKMIKRQMFGCAGFALLSASYFILGKPHHKIRARARNMRQSHRNLAIDTCYRAS